MKEVIQLMRDEGWFVTLYEVTERPVNFCLAVKIKETEDLFYLGKFLSEYSVYTGVCVYSAKSQLAYFPQLIVTAEEYQEICAQ